MQPSAFREAFAPTARAMLGNVAVAGRGNAADAVRIVKAIWTDERMEDVWRELHRMSRAEPAAFHFPARAGQWLRRANATAAERQAAGVCYLAEQAAWTALQGWPTATDAEMQANATAPRPMPDTFLGSSGTALPPICAASSSPCRAALA